MSRRQEALSPHTPPAQLYTFWAEDPGVAPWIALNPGAPYELLQQLEQSANVWIAAGLARNPKVSFASLRALSLRFPEAFFSLAPGRFDWQTPRFTPLPAETILSLLQWQEVSEAFVALAAKHSSVLVRALVARHPKAQSAIVEELSKDPQAEVRISAAQNGSLSEVSLWRLATEPIPAIRVGIARNPKSPPSLLAQLVASEQYCSLELYTALASHPNTPREIFLRLAGQLDTVGRRTLAAHPNAPVELLGALCRNSDPGVLRIVASHPRTEPGALLMLACNIDEQVRISVAQNPAATEEALLRLLRDSQDSVRRAAAGHPNVPESFRALLRRLWLKEDLSGYAEPQASLSVADLDSLEQYGLWGVVFLARHPALPEPVMMYLAGHRAPAVRGALARNPGVSERVLSVLAKDFDQRVRLVVSLHPRLPQSLREALLSVGEPALFDAARSVPSPVTPEAAELRQIAARFSATEARLEALAKDSAWYVRHAVAKNPSSSATMLEVLARDADPRVRRAVAQNPRTPYYALENLARDPEGSVQAKARALLQSSVVNTPISRARRHIVCQPTHKATQPAKRRTSLALQWTRWNQ